MPEEGPEPAAGKQVWVISCGQATEGCATTSNTAIEAGEEIGWEMTLFDGKLNPSLYSDGIRQAVAAGADGIILDAVDCAITRQALQEARDAGVKLLGIHALDCDDPAVGGEALWDGSLYYGEDWPDFRRRLLDFGATKADWIVANAGADAKIIEFRQDELLVIKYINDGFDQRIEELCPDCEIVTVDFVLADLGPPLTAKAQAALAQNPDATAVMIPYDSAVTLGIGAAIDSSGRQDELHVMGGEGFQSNIENARERQEPGRRHRLRVRVGGVGVHRRHEPALRRRGDRRLRLRLPGLGRGSRGPQPPARGSAPTSPRRRTTRTTTAASGVCRNDGRHGGRSGR